jgi:hypothetical protein
MFFMHYYRLSHAGKVCSGDYLPEEERDMRDKYLVARGELMWNYMAAFWIILGILLCSSIGIIIATVKSLH